VADVPMNDADRFLMLAYAMTDGKMEAGVSALRLWKEAARLNLLGLEDDMVLPTILGVQFRTREVTRG